MQSARKWFFFDIKSLSGTNYEIQKMEGESTSLLWFILMDNFPFPKTFLKIAGN